MKKHCFSICVFVFEGFVILIASKNMKFAKNADLEGFTCPTMKKDFEENKLNKMQCLTTCADSSSCFGVFHDEANMHCVGCNDKFLTNSSPPSLDGMKYHFKQRYLLVTEGKTRGNASLHCQTLGGHLADITSEEEEIYIEDQVFDSDYNSSTWIGASRNASGGIFYWEDGKPISDYFVKWGQKQPWDDPNEKCVVLLSSENAWSWHDYGCHNVFRSLCEFD